jgi:hypothetical protein
MNDNPWGDDYNTDDDDENGDDWKIHTFVWFRFVLFAMIFCIPLVRCILLFWRGGGRITFRRNENGRITGLEYHPPETNWTRPHLGDHDGTSTRRRKKKLTKEQVMELPEIIYNGNNDDESQRGSVNDQTPNDITVKMGSEDYTSMEDTVAASSFDNDDAPKPKQELTVMDGDQRRYINTTSTTCAICIEAFEHGESIRLLPRCGHAYHTDCILPWLTTREACCPLCKTRVLQSLEDEEQRGNNETQTRPGDSNENNNTEASEN